MPAVDLTESVRCMDLSGEMWTIPYGTTLHRKLRMDAAIGNGLAVLPVESIRAGVLPDPPDMEVLMQEWKKLSAREQNMPAARKLWLYGQFARLLRRLE